MDPASPVHSSYVRTDPWITAEEGKTKEEITFNRDSETIATRPEMRRQIKEVGFMHVYHDVMASVPQPGVCGLVAPLQPAETRHHLHPLVDQVDRRLHRPVLAHRPLRAQVPPPLGPVVAPHLIAELTLILWIRQIKTRRRLERKSE